MKDPISIQALVTAIGDLPADSPVDDPKKWYLTQQEHWMGWLSEYDGPGAYGCQTRVARDAKFAYNHTVEPKMLLYLADAAGVERELIAAANRAFCPG